jgi:hypothetical protein
MKQLKKKPRKRNLEKVWKCKGGKQCRTKIIANMSHDERSRNNYDVGDTMMP